MANRGPYLPNLEPLIAAGINPKTGLPYKFSTKADLMEEIKKNLRVVDRADAVNRFKWEGIPCNLTSQEIERLIYIRGQVCFFYDKDLDKYFFAAYALDGNIDAYGRYAYIRPVPFTNGTDDEKKNKPISDYFSKKKLRVIYDIKDLKEGEDLSNVAVILRDYTNHLSQTILPRATLDEPLLGVMAECIPFMRTALLLSTGVKGIRVQDADQAASVQDASNSMERGALTGNPFIPIVGNVDFQELNDGNIGKAEEFMLAYQSLDNLRLSCMGIDNNGVYEKKAHMLQDEQEINGGPIGLVIKDGLDIRSHFVETANGIWGLQMSCSQVNVRPTEDKYAEESEAEDETIVENVEEGENENE